MGELMKKYFFIPIKAGIFGFIGFFVILSATKYLGYLIGTQSNFSIMMDDVLLSSIGFLLAFLIKILGNFKQA
jgi:hypothetical protein